MKPTDLGLPPKFAEFRSYPGFDQFKTALDLATGDSRFHILNAATGSGKSATYAAAAGLMNARWLVLVGTKGLQSQLLSDFGPAGMRLVYGHRNYPCASRASILTGEGDAADDPEFQCAAPRGFCNYLLDVQRAQKAKVVVANYAYWFSMAKYSDPNLLGQFDLLVCDEAHTAPGWLVEGVSVHISRGRLRKALGLSTNPVLPTWAKIEQWLDWVRATEAACEDRLQRLDKTEHSEKKRVGRLIADLGLLGLVANPAVSGDMFTQPWIVIPDGTDAVTFSPRWGSDFAEQYLFRDIKKVILCSATVSLETADYLGIDRDQVEYTEVPSPFDVRRRPVIWVPTVRVDHRMSAGAKVLLAKRIDAVIEKAIDQGAGCGLIHSQSYERTQDIVRGSKFKPVLITHSNSRELKEAIAKFKQASRDGQFAVLVSPSIREGFDFADSQARWQIIVKVPFADTRDPLTAARVKADKRYSYVLIAEAILQMCGRIVRNGDDFGTTIFLDNHWGDYVRWNAPFPKWFKDSYGTAKNGVPDLLTAEKVSKFVRPTGKIELTRG